MTNNNSGHPDGLGFPRDSLSVVTQNPSDGAWQLDRGPVDPSDIDPVTGFKNRAAFEREYQEFYGPELGVVYCDVNGLNKVNKLPEKHAAGDAYLKAVAEAIKRSARRQEIYRAGQRSDEVVLLLPKVAPEVVEQVRDRLDADVNDAIRQLGLPRETYTGLSVGAVIWQPGDTPESLLQRADEDCEKSKDAFYDRIKAETGRDVRR